MPGWRAVGPIKQGDLGKSRLAPLLAPDARDRLVRRMAEHVLATLARVPMLESITVLSPQPFAGWQGGWHRDHGRGLNAELAAWRAAMGDAPVVIIHADLPLLTPEDVAVLLQTATARGAALAHDRGRTGTNALAIADARAFRFCFGADSFPQHLAQAPGIGVVARDGLMDDLDTPADAQALAAVSSAR